MHCKKVLDKSKFYIPVPFHWKLVYQYVNLAGYLDWPLEFRIMCETEEPNSIFDLIFHGHDIKVPSAQFGNNPNAERGFEQFPIIFRSEIRTKASRSIWNQQLSLFFFPPMTWEIFEFSRSFFLYHPPIVCPKDCDYFVREIKNVHQFLKVSEKGIWIS